MHKILITILILAFAVTIGCSHNPTTPTPIASPSPTPIPPVVATPPATVSHIASHVTPRMGLYPQSAKVSVAKASRWEKFKNWLFNDYADTVNADAPAPLAQSFEGICSMGILTTNIGLVGGARHEYTQFGANGYIALNTPMQPVEFTCQPTFDNAPPGTIPANYEATLGAADSVFTHGEPVFVTGTITTLTATALTVNGLFITCSDTLDTQSVVDGLVVQPYLHFADFTVVLGSGTNQLLPSCVLPVPAGDDVAQIEVDWAKI